MKIESSQLGSYEDAPWPDEHIVYENEDYVVYKDGYPVTEGHLLFVPKNKDKRSNITDCFAYAYCHHFLPTFRNLSGLAATGMVTSSVGAAIARLLKSRRARRWWSSSKNSSNGES